MAKASGAILVGQDSLTVTLGQESITWNWADVSRIVAFKRDEITTDLVCLGIARGTEHVEVNEDMSGWYGLLEGLSTHLPGALCGSDILQATVQPPFATRPAVVYERDAA